MNTNTHKICSSIDKCLHDDGPMLNLDQFDKQSTGKLGRNSKCKVCISASKAKHYLEKKKSSDSPLEPVIKEYPTVLTIGDCHTNDTQDLSRFNLLNKFILDKRPDVIVFIGDFLTLQCLSAWDANKRALMEGKRYYKEIAAGNKALDMAFKNVEYSPEIIFIEGNHEDRLTRYLEKDPTFSGAVSVPKDLRLEERGIKFIPYREYYHVNGVGFTHIPFNKVREIGGVNISRKASQVTVSSVIFGHTHNQELAHVWKPGMPHLQDIYCLGAFFEEIEKYMEGRISEYWRGLSLLNMWKEGRYDVESFSLGRLDKMYDRGDK